MQIGSFLGLKILFQYLVNFRCQFNDEGLNEELGTILSLMNISLREDLETDANDTLFWWADKKPADPAMWHDWKISIESLNKMPFKEKTFSLKQKALNKEQSFMAAFHFLNDYCWKNDNEISKGEVIEAIEYCIDDIEQGKKNPLWEAWLKYFEAEWQAKKQYSFD